MREITKNSPGNGRKKSIQSRTISIVGFLLILAVCQYFYRKYNLDYQAILTFIHLHQIVAPILFVLIYALFVILLFHTLPFNLGAGILFGGFWGGFLSIVATTIGAVIAFLISRSMFSNAVHTYFGANMVTWVEEKVEKNSWNIIAFTRLCAALPTGPINYILGLTKMKFSTYAIGTFVFLFIPSILISIIGDRVGIAIFEKSTTEMVERLMFELTALTLVLFLIPIMSRMLLKTR